MQIEPLTCRVDEATGRPVATSIVLLPADPTGAALAGVVRQLRSAACSGRDVIVDLSAAQHISPGLRRALQVHRRHAERRGRSWSYRGEFPLPRPNLEAAGR